MEQVNHFAETNADGELKTAIDRYVCAAKFPKYSDLEEIIFQLPICARAPLLALYFLKVREAKNQQANFELLIRLFQIAVRIYERHVLYGASNRFIGTDRFSGKNVKQLVADIGEMIQQRGFDGSVTNNLYYKEVMFDLCQKLPNFHVGLLLSNYCVMKVMQFVSMYAQDVQNLYSVRSGVAICEEQIYKQGWGKYRLLTAKSRFFENDLATENFSEFFENYSLR